VVEKGSSFNPAINSLQDYYMYADTSAGNIFIPSATWPAVYRFDEPQSVVVRAESTDDMTKARFVFLSLLPNLVFGLIPYVLFLLHPQWLLLGAFGAVSFPMGIGDYYNVFNCLTQVPKGGLVYMSGMHSYWYLPEEG
jgi:hypothetical protein